MSWMNILRVFSAYLRSLFCRHEIVLADFLVTIDERGTQHRVDYCAICGETNLGRKP